MRPAILAIAFLMLAGVAQRVDACEMVRQVEGRPRPDAARLLGTVLGHTEAVLNVLGYIQDPPALRVAVQAVLGGGVKRGSILVYPMRYGVDCRSIPIARETLLAKYAVGSRVVVLGDRRPWLSPDGLPVVTAESNKGQFVEPVADGVPRTPDGDADFGRIGSSTSWHLRRFEFDRVVLTLAQSRGATRLRRLRNLARYHDFLDVPNARELYEQLLAEGRLSERDRRELLHLFDAVSTVPERLWTARLVPGRNEAKSGRYQIATLHAEPVGPSEKSPVVASVFEERRVVDGKAAYTWTVELASKPGVQLPWPDARSVSDDGLHVAGVQRYFEWVRLPSSIPADGWLRLTYSTKPWGGAPIDISVSPLDTQIVNLSPLTASWPDGSRRQIDAGSYLVERIGGDGIEFRAEIPSDSACGIQVTDPVPLPPTLRAPSSEFFTRDGVPRFSTKYTKGC